MAMTVNDVRDFVRILREHPEWRDEVRREVVGEALISLPDLIRANSEAIAENTAAIRELREVVAQNSRDIRDLREVVAQNTRDIAQNSADIRELKEVVAQNSRDITQNSRDIAQNTSDIRDLREVVERLVVAVDGLTVRVTREQATDIGDLKGFMLEERYRKTPDRVLRSRFRKMRALSHLDLPRIDEAEDARIITEDQAITLRALDLIVFGREGRGADARDAYMAIEVSWTIGTEDVTRAADRAALLTSIGYPAYAEVAGRAIDDRTRALAAERNVEVFIEGASVPREPAA